MNSREDIINSFASQWYLAHNAMRQYHLSTLDLPLEGRTVLELGAGIGLHTKFFLDRRCKVTVTDGRPENVQLIRERYPGEEVLLLDIENPDGFRGRFEVVYCYGVLYHLINPIGSLSTIKGWCQDILLLETCVSTSQADQVKVEDAAHPPAALRGKGCYPDRNRLLREMKRLFLHTYVPKTHPMGMAFDMSTDWIDPRGECRAVFIGSHRPLNNDRLDEV